MDNHFNFDQQFKVIRGADWQFELTFCSHLTASEIAAVENDAVSSAIQSLIDDKREDLDGYSAILTLRETATGDAIMALTTEEGDIAIDGGIMVIQMSSEKTSSLSIGNYYYDLMTTSPGGIDTREMRGRLLVE